MFNFKAYQVNSAAHMGSIQENIHYPKTTQHNEIKAK